MKKLVALVLLIFVFSYQIFAQETADVSELSYFTIPYGFTSNTIDIHVYLSTQFWNYEHQALGAYANHGHDSTGHSGFIPYSGYIDLSSKIRKDMLVEAEFELYKGNAASKGAKVCKLRGVWQPSEYLAVSMGRDFGIIGNQELFYYPTSKYKLFTIPPFLHWSVIRYTGWWDTGVFLKTQVPFTIFNSEGKVTLDLSVTNGPGISASTVIANSDGYFFENFHSKARQSLDNNHQKPVAARLSILPWKNFQFGASYLDAKYDTEDKHSAQYIFSHFLLDWKDLTVIAEYGQLKLSTPSNDQVTQFSGYVAVGYTLLKDLDYIKLLQPVIRYEHFDSWKEDPSRQGYRTSISAGLRYSPFNGWIIKTAYQVTNEPYGPALDNDGFAAECVFEF